jgi:hypothetical protein
VGYVEVEQFSLAGGVEPTDFAGRDAGLQAWSYVHRPGIVRRTTAIGEHGEVLVVTLFSGATPPEPVAAGDDDDSPPSVFTASIDGSTYRRSVYRDLD